MCVYIVKTRIEKCHVSCYIIKLALIDSSCFLIFHHNMSTEGFLPIDAREEVINYPVVVGSVVEIAASSQVGEVVRFHLARLCRVGNGSVVVELVGENMSPAEIESSGEGMLFQLGYGDVVMPIWYLIIHPIAL